MSVDFDRMAAHLPADQRKQLSRQYRHSAKNETAAFLSGFFLGIFGVHHFYLGEWGRGFAHLILAVLAALVVVAGVLFNLPSLLVTIVVIVLLVAALIWEIVDLFQIDSKVRKRNLALAEGLIGAGALADSSALAGAVAKLDSVVAGAAVPAMAGAITADDVSAARAMAGEHNNAIMEEFDSSTTTYISDDPNATSPGAPMSWSETMSATAAEGITGAEAGTAPGADASGDDTLDMPAPEYVTHTHSETANTVTDSYEFDRASAVPDSADSPDATQPMRIPTTRESEAPTWPDHPPLDEGASPADAPVAPPADTGVPLAGLAAGAAAFGAGALLADAGNAGESGAAPSGPDVTDHHAFVPPAAPIADVEGEGATPHYVTLPDEQPTAASAGDAPLAVDASTIAHDATDVHPDAQPVGPVADVEANPSQPVYVNLADLPAGAYVPPIVPITDAGGAGAASGGVGNALAGLAAAGAVGAVGAGLADESAPEPAREPAPEAAPTSGPLMKRIRMKRQIVVDGKVVREEVVEKLVPVDTDTSSMVAEMDSELGHASKEEIAHMANLDPDASLDLRQRTERPHNIDEPQGNN